MNTSTNAAGGYRPQVETTFWSVGFFDFVKTVLKYLLSLYMQNLNGRCKQAVSELQLRAGASQISVVGSTREVLKHFVS